jgi:hypothetical protein
MSKSPKHFHAFQTNTPVDVKLAEIMGWTGGKSKSAVLRALILAATPDRLPRSWLNIPDDERELVAVAEGRNR